LKTLFGLIGLVLTVLGSGLLVRGVRNAWLEWHLRNHGVSARGTVTDLSDRNLKVDGVQLWQLQYAFNDFQGHRHLKTFDMSQGEAQGWKIGDVGGVLYDPARPTEARWLGRAQTQ
jgi:hypothetical protein